MKICLMCKITPTILLSLLISTTEVGLGSSAQASPLVGSQDKPVDANSEVKPRANRFCPNGTDPSFRPPCWRANSVPDNFPEEQRRDQPQQSSPIEKPSPTEKPSPIEKPSPEN